MPKRAAWEVSSTLRVTLTVLVCCAWPLHYSAGNPPNVDAVESAMRDFFERIGNAGFQIEYRVEMDPTLSQNSAAMPWAIQKLAMKKGGRLYGYNFAPHQQPDGTFREIGEVGTFDGKEANQLSGRDGFVFAEAKGVYWRDVYLQNLGYALRPPDRVRAEQNADELLWLPYAFKKRRYSVSSKSESLNGRECWRLECAGDAIWVSVGKLYYVEKREMLDPVSKRIRTRIVNSEPVSAGLGFELPKKSVREDFNPQVAPSGPSSRRTIIVSQVALGVDLDDGLFRIDFPVGSVVRDSTRSINYRVDADGKSYFKETLEEIARNRRTSGGIWSETFAIIVVCNVLAAVVLLAIWWRSRSRAL